MDVIARITVPKYVFEFYQGASSQIKGRSPEEVMADALISYAGMVSREMAKKTEALLQDKENAEV